MSSIMVGVIVIGLIGGVLAATVFAVIPWAQDKAAKEQLGSIVQAQNSYFGLSAAVPSPLPVGAKTNSFGNSQELESASLMKTAVTYCVSSSTDGKTYQAFSKSSTGKIWSVTDKSSSPVLVTGNVPSSCQFLTPYLDPTPKLTKLTYICDALTTGALPMNGQLTGKETWNDGVTNTYSNAVSANDRILAAGVTYTVTFDGTYSHFRYDHTPSAAKLTECLVSVDHWGMGTGVTNASAAFTDARKLVDVPDHIPTSITNFYMMFSNSTLINDPSISLWDVSNVTNMNAMFAGALAFNQPLNDWNTSKVGDMTGMFAVAVAFNQPLNKWDVSNVTTMSSMFHHATAFNQPLNDWKTTKLGLIIGMFQGAYAFNQPLDKWDTSNVMQMSGAFYGATAFNQPLDKWDTSNVTQMSWVFYGATAFNQDLSGWEVAAVKDWSNFANPAFNSAYLPVFPTP